MESLRQPALVLVAPKTFYSKICLIELNSMDTMVRQVKEVKHMKKELQLKKDSLEEHERGDLRRATVVPTANLSTTKQRVFSSTRFPFIMV